MAWLVAALSLIVIWVASVCKILFGATSTSKAASLDNGKYPQNGIFTAYYYYSELDVITLSWTSGNADGMGSIRKEELHQACAVLRVPLQQVKIVDHPNLQDGFGQVWSHDLLEEIVSEEVINHDIHTIITFDNYGVSGHCNHRDVHRGVVKFLQTNLEKNIKAGELVSLSIIRKYCGPIDIWLSFFSGKKHWSKVVIINEQPLKSFEAMAPHLSQWVWFRKLFVSFSSYTYTNALQRINP